MDRYGCSYQPSAQNILTSSANYLTKAFGAQRNVRIEAARIGKGIIKDLSKVDFDCFDALVINNDKGSDWA